MVGIPQDSCGSTWYVSLRIHVEVHGRYPSGFLWKYRVEGASSSQSSPTCTELVKLIQSDTFIQALSRGNNYRHIVDNISKVWAIW